MSFQVPEIFDNADSWGPTSTIASKFDGIPYIPFSKNDRLGRVADWHAPQRYNQNRSYQSRFGEEAMGAFSYVHEDDESFRLVDTRAVKPRTGQRTRQQWTSRNNWRDRQKQDDGHRWKITERAKKATTRRRGWFNWRPEERQTHHRESGLDVRRDWKHVEVLTHSVLNKLRMPPPPVQNLVTCGKLHYYNRKFDRVSARLEKPLKRDPKAKFHSVTTTDDVVLKDMASKNAGNVFATDKILATLMTATRSMNAWDIVVLRVGDKLYLDKRNGGPLDLDQVNETGFEALPEEQQHINSHYNLSREATSISQTFSRQVLSKDEEPIKQQTPNPFGGDEASPTAYLYRRWKLSDDVTLVARCSQDAILPFKGDEIRVSVRAFHEYDIRYSGVDWRSQIDTSRGAILATELKNNACKVAKWTAESIIGGSDGMSIGYISRKSPNNNRVHTCLGTHFVRSTDMANQLNLSMNNGWAVVHAVIEICRKLPEGKYVILKEAEKQEISLYDVPMNAFDKVEEREPGLEDSGSEDEGVGPDGY